MAGTVTIATWNTEWRSPHSGDGRIIKDRLRSIDSEVVCLTEADRRLLDDWGGHQIEGTTDWGGSTFEVRRKVLLWSKQPWRVVDQVGSAHLPTGMLVQATTDTSIGELTVIGVVIPYHMANVRSGRRDRKMWDDHRRYLDALPSIISALPPRSVVLGDFNQRIPSTWVPRQYQQMLAAAFAPMKIATTHLLGPDGKLSLDHIAYGQGLLPQQAGILSNIAANGRPISDHFGVMASFAAPSDLTQP